MVVIREKHETKVVHIATLAAYKLWNKYLIERYEKKQPSYNH